MAHWGVPARTLSRQLAAIVDAELRVQKLLGAWHDGDATDWAPVILDLVRRAHLGDDPIALAALETVVRAAGDPRLSYATRQAMYQRVAAAAPVVGRIFFAASPATVHDSQLDKAMAAERPLQPRERPLTLGERKSLARTHRRNVLVALCKDPHPDVVAILIDNPHVTEPDVVRVASLRPAVPRALTLIASHARWPLRAPVKRALVWNPATPLDVATRVATTLRPPDLRDVAEAPTLALPLRAHAAELLGYLRRAPPPTMAPPPTAD